MIGLTPRQADALRFIAGFRRVYGSSPTCEQIAKGLGNASKGSAHRIVECLEERGAVCINRSNRNRIEVLEPIAIPEAEPLYFVRIGESAL